MKSYRTYEMKNYVRACRVAAGLTQSDLALLIGTTQNTISSIENNKYEPSAYLAALLCDVFNVPFDKLFYWEYEGKKTQIYIIKSDSDSIARHFQYLRNALEFLKNDAELEEITRMDPFFE